MAYTFFKCEVTKKWDKAETDPDLKRLKILNKHLLNASVESKNYFSLAIKDISEHLVTFEWGMKYR